MGWKKRYEDEKFVLKTKENKNAFELIVIRKLDDILVEKEHVRVKGDETTHHDIAIYAKNFGRIAKWNVEEENI